MAVYFIQNRETRRVKIGHSGCPSSRLEQLQASCDSELVLLGTIPGGQQEERAWHERFAALRVRGEWFRTSPELGAAIYSAVDAQPQPSQRAEPTQPVLPTLDPERRAFLVSESKRLNELRERLACMAPDEIEAEAKRFFASMPRRPARRRKAV